MYKTVPTKHDNDEGTFNQIDEIYLKNMNNEFICKEGVISP